MNSYFNTKAENLAERSFFRNPYKLGEIRIILENALEEIYSCDDKIKFLNLYRSKYNDNKKEHQQECKKDDCMFMESYNTAMYFVEQKIIEISKQEEKERFWRYGTIIENLNISGDGQLFNFGSISGDIYQNTEKLKAIGKEDVSHALSEIANAVEKSKELSEHQIKEYLDSLKLLSQEALKEENERLPKSILKNILKYGLGTLNAVGSLASVTGVTLPVIIDYFLINS